MLATSFYNCLPKEWYFDEKGKSQALAYAEELSASDKRKLAKLFEFMGEVRQIRGENNFVMRVIRYSLSNRNHIDFYASFLMGKRL